AFLPPDVALFELTVGEQAGQLGAGPRTAGRAIISLPRTKNEILAVNAGPFRLSEKLNVIDLLTVSTGDPLPDQGVTNLPSKFGECLDIIELQLSSMVFD